MKILIAPSRSRRRPPLGFALIATLSMMILLTLIAVGLLTLSTVTVRSSKTEADLANARANARLGLMMALSQLQSTLGPDQRVSATADLAGASDGARLGNSVAPANPQSVNGVPNGLTKIQAGTRYWTGVWGNSNPSKPTAGNGNIYEKTPSPVLLNWLVSGNEQTTFNSSITANTFGQITSSSATPTYSPDQSVSGLSTSMSASAAVEIGGKKAALLVGPKSAGSQPHPTTGEPAIDRYVVAPMVDVVSGTKTTGRYAWWVGDEGAKARVNLVDPYASHTSVSGDEKARYRLMTAPRSGLEIVQDFANTAYASNTQSSSSNLESKVVDFPQINFIDAPKIPATTTQPRFHDLTTVSTGVLADSYNGGLRKDLTTQLEAGSLGSWTGTNGQAAGTGTGIIPASYSPQFSGDQVPRWNLLHDFNSMMASGVSSAPITPATKDKMGITPVISQIRILNTFEIVNPSSTVGATVTMRNGACPLFVVTNPYNVPISSSGPLRFTLALDPSMNNNASPYIRWAYGALNGTRWMLGPGGAGALGGKTFQTSGPVSLPPGSSKCFSLPSGFYQPATTGATYTLVEGRPPTTPSAIYEQFNVNYGGSTPGGNTIAQLRMGETNITSLVNVALRDSSGQILQEVVGLNVDLDYVGINSIDIQTNGAVPCGVFVFDLNLPGQRDYGITNGKHNTTYRIYADFNLRANTARFGKRVHTVAPYNWRTAASTEFATKAPFLTPTSFTDDTVTLYSGRATTALDANGVTSSVLYDLPQRASASEIPLFSVAQLQHANLTADSTVRNPMHQPGYAVGNSYQSPFLRRGAAWQDSEDLIRRNPPLGDLSSTTRYFDISYLLNASLWDGYCFSTVPTSGATISLANPRYKLRNDTNLSASALSSAARDANRAASVLDVTGAFNINSTSVDAWAAFLGGMNSLPALSGSDTPGAATATFARSIRQPGGWADAKNGDSADAYKGFRKLTPIQVRTLAEAIVKQVRQRGPFVSLAQFVNRTLVDAASDTKGIGLYGPLQAAIDAGTDINTLAFPSTTTTTDEAKVPPNKGSKPPSDVADTVINGTYDDNKGAYGIFHPNAVATATDGDNHYASSSGAKLTNKRSAAIPGWLTQADVLQAVGPLVSARSDTFKIRAYGEARNPTGAATDPPTARAWCEAVVQRIPDYFDSSTSAEASPASASAQNQTLGRRFKVISFRWLTPDEI